jgi:hypothetical protein
VYRWAFDGAVCGGTPTVPASVHFEKYWQNVMAQNLIRVPQGCPTLEKAMALAVIFSQRKEYTADDPLKIKLDEGVHKIVGNGKVLNVTCTHYFCWQRRNQQHVKFEELAVTNGAGAGLYLTGSETNVDVLKCVVKKCGGTRYWDG